MSQDDSVGTISPTWTTPISRHGQQFDICLPNNYQVPLMLQFYSILFYSINALQLGGLLP